MNIIYKADKLYLVQLEKVRSIDSNKSEENYTFTSPKEFRYAKKVNVKGRVGYKLITKNKIVYEPSFLYTCEGETVVSEKTNLNTAFETEFKFITHTALKKSEKIINSAIPDVSPRFVETEKGKMLF